MANRTIVNTLASLAALIVLIGVAGAASTVFAAEPAAAPTATVLPEGRETTIAEARIAITETAASAAASLKAETAFDLDNQLTDITSTLIAAAD